MNVSSVPATPSRALDNPPSQQITWTALPAGNRGEMVQMSVFVSAWLDPGSTAATSLRTFPDFLDWPATLDEIHFALEFDNGVAIHESAGELRRVQPARGHGRSATWLAMFGTAADTPFVVRRQSSSVSSRAAAGLISYSSRHLKSVIERGLAPAAAGGAPMRHEAIAALAAERRDMTPRVFSLISERILRGRQQLFAAVGPLAPQVVDLFAVPPDVTPDEWHVGLAVYFQESLRRPSLDSTPRTNELEFHQAIGDAGQYPPIGRHLGLILDFEFAAGILARQPQAGRLRVVPTRSQQPGVVSHDYSPFTAFESRPTFATGSKDDSEIRAGCLDFTDVDAMGVFLSSLEQIDSLTETLRETTAQSAQGDDALVRDRMPITPRSRGIIVTRDRAYASVARRISTALITMALRDSLSETTLYADDVLRGYRMDIRYDGRWYSLTRRSGHFQFPVTNRKFQYGDDEGWTSVSVVRVASPTSHEPLESRRTKTRPAAASEPKRCDENERRSGDPR
jgi:hypothetical protein